jgi:hypothetical protein
LRWMSHRRIIFSSLGRRLKSQNSGKSLWRITMII